MSCSGDCGSSGRTMRRWLSASCWSLALCASTSLLSACSGGLTPAHLSWHVPYVYWDGKHRTGYTINVRGDSIILGSWNDKLYLVLDPATGAIRDTLRSLDHPVSDNML